MYVLTTGGMDVDCCIPSKRLACFLSILSMVIVEKKMDVILEARKLQVQRRVSKADLASWALSMSILCSKVEL